MVYTYKVRLSPNLAGAICYMGLDKHENEVLISSGVPTDVWFHVDGLSSAHVYLRLPSRTPSLTLDDIGEETMEDLCQLVKNNSIKGCKMSSVKVVYTFWSNLRKDLVGMDVGTVGFKSESARKLRRVEKDKGAVNRIEKSRREVGWNYWDVKRIWEDGERERIKKENREKYIAKSQSSLPPPPTSNSSISMYDAITEATISGVDRARERAEGKGEGSGLNAALKQLDGIYLEQTNDKEVGGERDFVGKGRRKEWELWRFEEEERVRGGLLKDVEWGMERGLEKGSSERIFLNPTSSTSSPFDRWYKWATYWKEQRGEVEEEEGNRDDDVGEDVKEEMEVIKAIFGDDVVVNTSGTPVGSVEGGGGREEFCVIYSIPLTTEEAGDERTGCDDSTIVEYFCGSPYPNDTVVYCVKGGGLGGVHIREVYGIVEDDDVGVCRVFEHLEKVKQAIGTVWERVGEREGVKEEEDRKAFKERRVKEKDEMEKERKGKGEETTATKGSAGGGNGGEARINAKDRLGKFGKKTMMGGGEEGNKGKEDGKKIGKWAGKSR
ncbi:hypothetical protein TrCOL_g10064 [Triparma columacea]|uniref:NFACT RNA-binding domain-containing protein n=1 Tax=Triparma columacea TaxID=722753 RepID=A0A9W7GPI6_9STRA|nr:hypothetical protein TrCOL_g10064 [Triparma columacea]